MGRVAQETISGAKWGLIQKFTLQPVQFVYGIILARLITPEEFGILGLTSIFFAVAAQLQDCGFGAALIRKQDRTEEDCSTMFWYNTGASFILSTALFLAAPWFADFFNQPPLTNITRVSAAMLFLNSSTSVHRALFSAKRDFKTPAIVGIVTTLAGIPVCLYLAYTGWSYWSIVIQGVVTGLLGLVIIWIVSPWKPKFIWSNKSFKEFFGFGFKLVLSGLFSIAYEQSRQFIIGKFYSPASLGNFNKGFHVASMPSTLTQSIINGVIYPVISTIQDNEQQLVAVYRKYIRLNNIVNQIVLWTMVCNSHALILCLYGDSWEEAYVYAQLICFGTALNSLSSISSNIFMVKGRTDIILKTTVFLRILSIAAMVVGACFSIVAICYAAIFAALVWFLLTLYYTGKVIDLTYKEQIRDYLPYITLALTANIPSLLISGMDWFCGWKLAMGGASAVMIYALLLWARRDQMAAELLRMAIHSNLGQRILRIFKQTI